MEILAFQLLWAAVIFGVTVLCSVLPLFWTRAFKQGETASVVLRLFLLFTGGVFLGAGMLHMLPEAVEMYQQIQAHPDQPIPDRAEPKEPHAHGHSHGPTHVYLLAVLGFLLIALLERIQLVDVPEDRARIVAVTTSAQATEGGADLCYVEIDPMVLYARHQRRRGSSNASSGPPGSLPKALAIAQDLCSHGHSQHLHPHAHESQPLQHDHRTDASGSFSFTNGSLQPLSRGSSTYGSFERDKQTIATDVAMYDANRPEVFLHSPARTPSTPGNLISVTTRRPKGVRHQLPLPPVGPPDQPSLRKQQVWEQEEKNQWHAQLATAPGQREIRQDEAEKEEEEAQHLHLEHHHHVHLGGRGSWMPYMLALMFSLHSFVEGLALGVQPSVNANAVSIVVAIMSHKLLEALAVSSHFVREDVGMRAALPSIMIYCVMTPCGILLGAFLSSLFTGLRALKFQCYAQAFAAGSFIYLSMHELEDAGGGGHKSPACRWYQAGWLQITLMLLGVLAMGALT